MFARYENVKIQRCANEKRPQDKGDVKTEGVKENNFDRERSQNKSVTTGNKKNCAKRKPCQEYEMWREENVKRRRSQGKEMPIEKDAKRDVNGKRLK